MMIYYENQKEKKHMLKLHGPPTSDKEDEGLGAQDGISRCLEGDQDESLKWDPGGLDLLPDLLGVENGGGRLGPPEVVRLIRGMLLQTTMQRCPISSSKRPRIWGSASKIQKVPLSFPSSHLFS
ncbi:uncharacterized protein PGTG_19859 [Puccinia graminis f. sp. tritici CRL 75-36-700-3]|uniref:Uncharacterized protein n=1 Tax=Puccinia graminis f. sp. tritici (strain CRL 75-36-700-3 / race SCCL) TaxID=418459 RepID=E3LB99_PUCGT|nr:uncharacterized protein PGTG_19859 [Puccinia graminis f. sp. tritici CRL 75-36-700-3]EFP93824.1 hypothetical protein PGTG_19859 [Puccinia graminis f. sp. tritici CRL 75-36-700-3]